MVAVAVVDVDVAAAGQNGRHMKRCFKSRRRIPMQRGDAGAEAGGAVAAEGEEVLFPMPALARPGLTCDCRPCHSRNTPTYIPESASSRSAKYSRRHSQISSGPEPPRSKWR
jgi:hypothetical protein